MRPSLPLRAGGTRARRARAGGTPGYFDLHRGPARDEYTAANPAHPRYHARVGQRLITHRAPDREKDDGYSWRLGFRAWRMHAGLRIPRTW